MEDKKMNLGENPTLTEEVESDNELKTWLVNYVGEKHNPEDGKITVEMIVDTLSEQFPEFLMVVAEENWVRGYHQALTDVAEGEKMLNNESDEISDEEPAKEHKKCKNCE